MQEGNGEEWKDKELVTLRANTANMVIWKEIIAILTTSIVMGVRL